MNLRFLCISCFTLLAASSLCAANGLPAQSTSANQTSVSVPTQTPDATRVNPPRIAPPTRAEMRAMSAEQLDAQGDRLRLVKDYLSARDCYREEIRKHPTADTYNKVAISELLLRHPADAEKAARKAVRKDKLVAEAWNNLGVSYYIQNRLKDAIHAYERALSLKPDVASFHNNMAATLMDLKEFDRGTAEYRKAFELDPSFFEHSSQNGVSAHMGSTHDRALFSFVMARLFAGNGDLDRALHFLRSAMEDGYPKIDDVYRDQEFARVRNDERFLALMKDRPVAVR